MKDDIVIFALCLLGCGTKAEPSATSATAAPPAATQSAPAPPAAPVVAPEVPSSASWPSVAFAPMKISFRRAPSLAEAVPEMTQDAAARWGSQVWSMSTATKQGVAIAVAELGKGAAHDRKRLLDEMKEGAVAGEILLQDDSAVVKRSRVIGKKSKDGTPQLSETHVDLVACKKVGDSDFCSFVAGGVDLSLGRPGLSVEEAMEVVAFVRSIERTK